MHSSVSAPTLTSAPGETVTTRPLVSALIPAYNSAAFVREAIESALTQDYRPLELLVCDDGATDNTRTVVETFADKVRVFSHPDGRNHGLGATRNLLLRQAQGQFIALLDADDIWLPGKITAQVEAFLANPTAGICHTAYERFGDPAQAGLIVIPPENAFHGMCFDRIFFYNGMGNATVMFRRDAMPPDGFAEDIPCCEDYPLYIEMLFERPAIYLPRILARYRRHAAQLTSERNLARSNASRGEARLRFLDKHGHQLPPQRFGELRSWTIEEMKRTTYSMYWKGDYRGADLLFGWMRRRGIAVPWKHRMRAKIGAMRQR